MKNVESPRHKALQLNLEPQVYGTLAEIGAGQEVARHFFRAGGASGSVAKTMSAYDMIFSDSIYGKEESGRYVCESRLKKMLTKEMDILLERLSESKGKTTKFFSYANTMSTLNYQGTNQAHGWMGLSFQHEPEAIPSQIIIHVKMHDTQAVFQQEAVGRMGVNLIYGAFYASNSRELLDDLFDDLHRSRIEVDLVRFSGPAFKDVDNRLMNLLLVKRNRTNSVLFNEQGECILPQEFLYKKNVMVTRGSYRPPTLVNKDMLEKGIASFAKDIELGIDQIISLSEITLTNANHEMIEEEDFLSRLTLLAAMGQKVMLTNYPEYHRLSSYFAQFKLQNLAVVLGTYNFEQIFKRDYNHPSGGILSSLGQLFRENVKVYLYPYRDVEGEETTSLENLELEEGFEDFISYLQKRSQLHSISDYDDSILHIYSRKVLNMIKAKEEGWEKLVPKEVAQLIQEKGLFQS